MARGDEEGRIELAAWTSRHWRSMASTALSSAQLRALAHSRDLIGLGMLAADVRARRHGTRGTFVRVQSWTCRTSRPTPAGSASTCHDPQAGEGGTFVDGRTAARWAPQPRSTRRA